MVMNGEAGSSGVIFSTHWKRVVMQASMKSLGACLQDLLHVPEYLVPKHACSQDTAVNLSNAFAIQRRPR